MLACKTCGAQFMRQRELTIHQWNNVSQSPVSGESVATCLGAPHHIDTDLISEQPQIIAPEVEQGTESAPGMHGPDYNRWQPNSPGPFLNHEYDAEEDDDDDNDDDDDDDGDDNVAEITVMPADMHESDPNSDTAADNETSLDVIESSRKV